MSCLVSTESAFTNCGQFDKLVQGPPKTKKLFQANTWIPFRKAVIHKRIQLRPSETFYVAQSVPFIV